MKRIIRTIILAALILFFITGCGGEDRTEVSREAIQTRYTSAHTEIRTQCIVIGGNVSTIPIPHHQDEKYEVQFQIVYDDGSSSKQWIEVTQSEYKEYQDIIK